MNRSTFRLLLTAILSAACVVTGCQWKESGYMTGAGSSLATRNNSYSLLHQLLDEQKDVSLLRFIKHEDHDLKDLMMRIAAASRAGADELEGFAEHDPSLHLNNIWLPPGEVATRAAIAESKKKALLDQIGNKFELSLLLAQTEALNYGWHLAEVASKNEPQPDRAHALTAISQEMENFYDEAYAMLLAREK